MSEKQKLLFLLPVLGHPRHAKRIEMLQEQGFEVGAIAFERDYHKGRLPNCEVVSLGRIEHGQYGKRILRLISSTSTIRKEARKADLIYAFGLDLAMTASIATTGLRKPIAAEVGDIGDMQTRSDTKGKVARVLIRKAANRCKFLVVTAPRFLEVYFREWLGCKVPGLVVENKLEAAFVEEFSPKLEQMKTLAGVPFRDRPLRIGYFGLLRDKWTLDVFEQIGQHFADRVQVEIRGIPFDQLKDLETRVEPYPNLVFHGEYKSPDDLPAIYSGVDLVWGCYDPIGERDWNLRWARPNRFYESCFFQKPLVSRDGSQDAVDVARYGIGYVMKEVDPVEGARRIAELSSDQLVNWSQNMQSLPHSVYSYTTEGADIASEIRTATGIDRK